jgi:HEAT repeat protein
VILETLVQDKNEKVAQQATVRYVNSFMHLKAGLIKPQLLIPHSMTKRPDMSDKAKIRAVIDYCLGTRPYPEQTRHGPSLKVLEDKNWNEPRIVTTINLVGLFGEPNDAAKLLPALRSENDYVLLNAAKALHRLGHKKPAVEALKKLAKKDVGHHLFYVTEAIYALKEIGDDSYQDLIAGAMAKGKELETVSPNILNHFLFLAAEDDENCW